MTPDDPTPPSDEVADPEPHPPLADEPTAAEDPAPEAAADRATAADRRSPAPGRRRTKQALHVPASWRDPVAVPRWQLVTGVVLVSVLVAVTIAASSLALTDPDPAPTTNASPDAVTVIDPFDRGSEEFLGLTPSGEPWDELVGDWGVGFGAARIIRPDGNLPSLAVVDLEDTDGLVRMRIGTVISGMGIAVRVRDAGTYLAIEAEPGFGTYAIRRAVNGQITDLGGVGLANAADGAVVEVRMRGDSIDIYIDGRYVKTITDRATPDATRAGLIGEPGTAAARWDRFDAQNSASLTQGLAPPQVATTAED